MVREGPMLHLEAFALTAGFTPILIFNFAWFREPSCVVMCPYGRHVTKYPAHSFSRPAPSGSVKPLSSAEAAASFATQGPNELTPGKPKSALRALGEQLNSPLTLLLLGAALAK